MTDRELLEFAAKAASIPLFHHADGELAYSKRRGLAVDGGWWNPLRKDGDALRLAVQLRLQIVPGEDGSVDVSQTSDEPPHAWACVGEEGCDPYAATRRAIVRAAAEIGVAMPGAAD